MQIKKNKITNRIIVDVLGVRLKFRLFKKVDCTDVITNLLYELADCRTLQSIKLPKVLNLSKSIDLVIDSKKSIARFGDGEFKLIVGESINFQKYDENLAKRLREILKNGSEELLIGIPDVFGYCNNAYFRNVMTTCRDELYKYIDFNSVYIDASITRQLNFKTQEQGCLYFEKFKNIWKNREIVIVEGEGSRLGVGNNLFSEVKSIKRILCPIKDAYFKYDKIFEACRMLSKDKLFILSLGPTATVLAFDLSKEGYRALDVGHLDAMYEMFLRKADSLVPIEGKIFFNDERNYNKLADCKDKSYNEQIFAVIH